MLVRENEKGYTLLVVLFVVTFIMIVSTTFVSASLSNAKQERVVDTNNMAVVAAEMGIDYYLNKTKIEETKAANSTLTHIEGYLNEYNNCDGNNKTPGCVSIKTIDEIKVIALEYYTKALKDSIKLFDEEDPTQINSSSQILSYKVNEPKLEVDGEIITITFNSIGSSISMPNRELSAKFDFTTPEFIERLAFGESNEETTITPGDIFEYFSSHEDYEKVDQACSSQNGKCESGKFYSSGSKTVNNPNNKNHLIWVHKGLVDLGNMNSMGTDYTLIVESVKVDNMNSMNGRLILLGKVNQSGQIISKISTKLESNGKVCINVDGYPKTDVEKISYDVKNNDVTQVLFYSGAENPIWPNNVKDDKQKRTGSLSEFVNECSGIELLEPSYNTNIEPPKFEVDVKY